MEKKYAIKIKVTYSSEIAMNIDEEQLIEGLTVEEIAKESIVSTFPEEINGFNLYKVDAENKGIWGED